MQIPGRPSRAPRSLVERDPTVDLSRALVLRLAQSATALELQYDPQQPAKVQVRSPAAKPRHVWSAGRGGGSLIRHGQSGFGYPARSRRRDRAGLQPQIDRPPHHNRGYREGGMAAFDRARLLPRIGSRNGKALHGRCRPETARLRHGIAWAQAGKHADILALKRR